MTDHRVKWTDEAIAMLKQMRLRGCSASQIAKAIPWATRNAVIGKIHRLGLDPLTPARKPRPAPRAHRRSSVFRPRPAPAVRAAPAEAFVPANPVLFMELERHHCRWPAWPNDARPRTLAEMVFCGDAVAGNATYCPHHCLTSQGRT